EPTPISLATKLRYLELLADAGLTEIEATSFVAPAAIPQLADADELMATLPRRPGVRYPVLVPNLQGLARAEAAGAEAIAVFTAATDAFTTRNIRMTVDESLTTFAPVLARAGELGWWRRGYVSTAFGCPYSGAVSAERAVDVATRPPGCPVHCRCARQAADDEGRPGGRLGRRDRPTDRTRLNAPARSTVLGIVRPTMNGVVLVLNQNYEPLNVCNLPRAFRLVFGEK